MWQLDRLGRNMRHLIDTVTSLHERRIQFRSLRENIDTTTASGRAASGRRRGSSDLCAGAAMRGVTPRRWPLLVSASAGGGRAIGSRSRRRCG
ncbi:recombinase family protein [Dactylosporangium cerinum]|uniref:Recombinase family protein n=1 Tax=Dactylosporangium cerinum TaxID=1434730 RepID=A0ABV9WHZ9_9ACTN